MPEKFRFLFSLISYIYFFYQKVKTHLTIKSPLCCSNKVQKVNFPSSHQHDKSQSPTMILWFIRHVYLVIQINIFSYIFDLHPQPPKPLGFPKYWEWLKYLSLYEWSDLWQYLRMEAIRHGIFPTQGLNRTHVPWIFCTRRQILYHYATWEALVPC